MKKLEGFKLGDKDFVPSKVPQMVKRALDFLESTEFKQLYRTLEVADRLGVIRDAFRQHTTNPLLAENRYDIGYNNVVWGSKKTIAELRRVLSAQKD